MEKGQIPDLGGIFETLIILFILAAIVLPILGVLLAMMTNTTCSSYIAQLNECESKINTNYQLYQQADANYSSCLVAYNTLEKTKITKDDLTRFSGDLQKALIENQQVRRDIANMTIQMNQIQNITNNIAILWISIFIDISLFGATLVEVVFFRFKHAKKISTKIYNKLNKVEVKQNIETHIHHKTEETKKN
jgi:hypothetical protein